MISEGFNELKTVLWGTPLLFKDHHLSYEKLEEMRYRVDTLGDDCLIALREEGLTIDSFISSLKDADPSIYEDPRLRAFAASVLTPPDWLDWDKLKHGQFVFLKHYTTAALAVLYVSLIGGFAIPKITKVLNATSYMTKDREATYRRLVETWEMVIDCVDGDDALLVGSPGFNSVLKVRLLHSRVRLNLLGKIKKTESSSDSTGGCPFGHGYQQQTQNFDIVSHKSSVSSDGIFPEHPALRPHPAPHPTTGSEDKSEKSSTKSCEWDSAQYGLPINQEDMVGTLLSFSTNVIDTIRKVAPRWSLTCADEEAYLHLWRYIGHLIGVHDDINPCSSYDRSGAVLESIVIHLMHPDEQSGVLARHLVNSVTYRWPLNWSYEMHSEMTRAFLGPQLSDALGIKKDSLRWVYTKMIMGLTYFTSALFQPLFAPNNRRIMRVRRILRAHVNAVLYPKKKEVNLSKKGPLSLFIFRGYTALLGAGRILYRCFRFNFLN